ncbi:unnamed protein product [marine sediment metagenome]|uniref:Uncharacterized protein n=1 Tax=marine sediment metagenome TaxID=412755 RepID=X1VE43_9ZZZZ
MSEDTPANRLKEVIQRFQTIREPLITRRKERRKAFLDTLLDGLKARTEAKTNPRSEVLSVEEVLKENEELKARLKKEKEEEEDSHGFAGRGVRTTKDGKRDIAIEF